MNRQHRYDLQPNPMLQYFIQIIEGSLHRSNCTFYKELSHTQYAEPQTLMTRKGDCTQELQ